MRRDEAVTRALEEWFAAGGGDVDAFLAKHDGLAPELRDHLAALDLLDQTFERPVEGVNAPWQIGPYRILREIGRGGMGTVYHAEGDDGSTVAVKVLHRHLLARPGFFKRFLREADLGRSVTHDNVVRTLDADALLVGDQEQHFLVMEYVEGRTLRDLVDEVQRVPENLVRHIGHEVAQGLAAIHDVGVVHRDLKPENVLITEDHVVKVMDLGVARLQDDVARLSATGAFVGSIHYAAPEQFGGGDDGEADARADLHALGVLLYELAAGEHPFPGDDYRTVMRRIIDEPPRRLGDVNPQVSPFLEELVHRLLAKPRAERFASAGDVLEILEAGEQSEWWRERARALRVETKRPLRRIRVPRETALYGRDHEIGRLRGLFGRARDSDGNVVLLEGEAGVGKSRLVDEFVTQLVESGENVNFVHASYPPGGAATAMGAFSAAYREFLGVEGLEDSLAEHLTITPVLVPAFAALLRGDAATRDAEPLTKDSLQTCFVHLTRSLAKERTTVVLIDDLHFAPHEGRALFASLALAPPGHRILLIGTMRPGVPEDWTASVTRLEHAAHFGLQRLGPKDVGRLLIDAFRSDRLAEELGFKIVMKSDGNPFFVFEIIRGLREGQLISQRPDGTWVTTQVIDDVQVPSSVTDLVRARLSDLSDEERNLLDVAACWGFEFDPLLIAEVVGLARVPALRLLARIESKHRLVRSIGARFAFDHHQVQETLYEMLPDLLRQEYHGELAEMLERRSGSAQREPAELDGAVCVDLCEHYLRSSNPLGCRRLVMAALVHLADGHLHDRCVNLAERAIASRELLEGRLRVRVLLQMAWELNILGDRSRQQSAAEEAAHLAATMGDPSLQIQALGQLGTLYFHTSRLDLAVEFGSRARDLAQTVGDREAEAKLVGNVALAHSLAGDYALAESLLIEQCELFAEIGDLRGRAKALGVLGGVLIEQGRTDEGEALVREWLEDCRERGDKLGESMALGSLGMHFLRSGRLQSSRMYFRQKLEIARSIGYRPAAANATSVLGYLAIECGEFDDAKTLLDEALQLSRETGKRPQEAAVLGDFGTLYLAMGQLSRAEEMYRTALELNDVVGLRSGRMYAHGNLGCCLLEDGRTAEALDSFQKSLRLAESVGAPGVLAVAHGHLADLYRSAGDHEAAVEHLILCSRHWRAAGNAAREAEALVRLSQARRPASTSAAASEALERAISLARSVNAIDIEARARCEFARLQGTLTEAEEYISSNQDQIRPSKRAEVWHTLWRCSRDASHLQRAKQSLDDYVSSFDQTTRTDMLTNLRVHREIMEAWREEFGEDGDGPEGASPGESPTRAG